MFKEGREGRAWEGGGGGTQPIFIGLYLYSIGKSCFLFCPTTPLGDSNFRLLTSFWVYLLLFSEPGAVGGTPPTYNIFVCLLGEQCFEMACDPKGRVGKRDGGMEFSTEPAWEGWKLFC